MGTLEVQGRNPRMIYKRVYDFGEYILEILDESLVWPDGDPIPDEKIIVFLDRRNNPDYEIGVSESE